MYYGLCHFGNWGFLGGASGWGWVGLVLYLVFWVGLLAGLAVLAVRALRRAPAHAVTVPDASGQPTAQEILLAWYARGEITRERYELLKRDIG